MEASLEAAAAAEALYAMGEAWQHYERALEIWDRAADLAPRLPLTRLEVMRRAEEAALRTGEAARAVELAGEVISQIESGRIPCQPRWRTSDGGRYLWTAGRGPRRGSRVPARG